MSPHVGMMKALLVNLIILFCKILLAKNGARYAGWMGLEQQNILPLYLLNYQGVHSVADVINKFEHTQLCNDEIILSDWLLQVT